jgi:peptidoglycan-associated lipoprotein
MIRILRYVLPALICLTFVANTGCSSKKKAKDDVAAGDVAADPNVASKDLQFDPLGSDSGNIAGLSTVNFELDKASLTESARSKLAENAKWIQDHPGLTIQIEGHCDSRGSVEYNLALGERRAQSVKSYLTNLGVDGKRLTIISYGEEKPVATGDSESVFAQNRRANFVPLPN